MARPEPASVPIWLKLSEADAARMERVLARPEFAGWTRAEWCLEIIKSALRYYTRPRPAADPGPEHPPAPAAAESVPPVPEPVPPAPESRAGPVMPEPYGAAGPVLPAVEPVTAEPARVPVESESVLAEPESAPAIPEPVPDEPESAPAAPEPAPAGLESAPAAREPAPAGLEPPDRLECTHPADARDYETGTCAVCGAILWD